MTQKKHPAPKSKEPQSRFLFWVSVSSLLLIIIVGWALTMSGIVQEGFLGAKSGFDTLKSAREELIHSTADSREDVSVLINDAVNEAKDQMEGVQAEQAEEEVRALLTDVASRIEGELEELHESEELEGEDEVASGETTQDQTINDDVETE